MINIPNQFTQEIQQAIEWHLNVYIPEQIFDLHLKRILEHFFERNCKDGIVQVEEKELYYINECISNAINNSQECGISKDALWDIWDWIVAERKKLKE